MFDNFSDYEMRRSAALDIKITRQTTWDRIERLLEFYVPSTTHGTDELLRKTVEETENFLQETSLPRALFNRAAPILTTFVLPVRDQGLALRSLKQPKEGELKRWMDIAEQKLLSYLLEADGRVYREMEAAVKSALLYGNCALSLSFEEGSARPKFVALSLKEIVIETSHFNNEITAIMRKSNEQDPKEGSVIYDEVWFLDPKHDPRSFKVTDPRTWGVVYRKWRNRDLVEDKRVPYIPISFARLWSQPGAVYGEGIGKEVLADTGRLYKVWEYFLKAVEKQTAPAAGAREYAVEGGKLDLSPDAINKIKQETDSILAGRPVVEPLVQVVELNSTIKFLEMLNESLQFATLFDILILPEISGMTVSEIVTRVEQKLQVLVPIISGLQQELVASTARKILMRLVEVGVVEPPPGDEPLSEFDFALTTRFDHLRRLNNVAQAAAFVQSVQAVASVAPETMDAIDTDNLVRYMADSTLLPGSVLRDRREVEEIRENRQKMMMLQQMQEQQQQQGGGGA